MVFGRLGVAHCFRRESDDGLLVLSKKEALRSEFAWRVLLGSNEDEVVNDGSEGRSEEDPKSLHPLVFEV